LETLGGIHELYLKTLQEVEGLRAALKEFEGKHQAATEFIGSQQALLSAKNAGIRVAIESINTGDLPIAIDTLHALLPEGFHGS
jgi:hypothetical protein